MMAEPVTREELEAALEQATSNLQPAWMAAACNPRTGHAAALRLALALWDAIDEQRAECRTGCEWMHEELRCGEDVARGRHCHECPMGYMVEWPW